MFAVAVIEQFAAARLELDRAGELLLTPSPAALDRCSAALESTTHRLTEWQSQLTAAAGNPEALAEAWRLRDSFRRAERLLQTAADFHFNWLRLRGTMTGGYTHSGDAAPVVHAHRISLQA